MDFLHGVSAGQTVNITNGYGPGGGAVTVDDVKDFHATTNLSVGDLLLKGVTASSYAFEGNTLILNTTKGAFDLTVNNAYYGGSAIGVSQLAGGVVGIYIMGKLASVVLTFRQVPGDEDRPAEIRWRAI